MKIALLGLEFENSNMGCQALSYSFAHLFSEVARSLNIEVQYYAILFDDSQKDIHPNTDNSHVEEYKIEYKSFSFWRNAKKLFKKCDLIVDFTGGDSFSDIYGCKRFLLGSLLKNVAINSKTPFMLAPQTYGPFLHSYDIFLAKRIINRARWVFSRDMESAQLVKSLTRKVPESYTDVAFVLPYKKALLPQNGKIKVGINVSGFLWNQGYSFAKLSLGINYPLYNETILKHLLQDDRYEVYLIPHVGYPGDVYGESDYSICSKLHDIFPDTILINSYASPMDLKNYISAMDIFIGARMHAAIAAFSSGVATIPVSYSPKFEGLFGSLGYNRLISARTGSTESAVEETLDMIEKYDTMTEEVNECLKKANVLISRFKERLAEIINECSES